MAASCDNEEALIRSSGQAVYTLEVYTLLYSYISVTFVSLLVIARADSVGVGVFAGARLQSLYLEEFRQEPEMEKGKMCFLLLGGGVVLV